MVSKANEDFPDPLRPVITVRLFRGISTSMFFRLCWRAPCTVIRSSMAKKGMRRCLYCRLPCAGCANCDIKTKMKKCVYCGGSVCRVRRTFLDRLQYMAVYACRDCHAVLPVPRRYRRHFGRDVCCPICGTVRVAKLRG